MNRIRRKTRLPLGLEALRRQLRVVWCGLVARVLAAMDSAKAQVRRRRDQRIRPRYGESTPVVIAVDDTIWSLCRWDHLGRWLTVRHGSVDPHGFAASTATR
jgi:hypothetical protein